jgi:hypothetical protein
VLPHPRHEALAERLRPGHGGVSHDGHATTVATAPRTESRTKHERLADPLTGR